MTAPSSPTRFDPSVVPFGCFGSYFALSLLPENETRRGSLYLRKLRGPALGDQALFRVELTQDGVPCPYTCAAEPTQITFGAEADLAENTMH